MRKIFMGVGHGGTDTGAVANGLKEKDLNLAIALACRDVLERHGVTVLLSRTNDEDDDVNEEVRECNAFDPDFAVDIHNNAGGGDGAEVFHSIHGGAGKNLAENVNKEIIAIGQNSRGVKVRLRKDTGKDYYAFIRETDAPAIIVECAFIDNKTDIAIIDTVAEQKKMGVAIAKGILATLGITYKEKAVTGATDNVPDAYAADAIKWAINNGILYGDSNGNYKLHTNVSRQDMLVFLYRAMSK
jgi:N-acetylmuramoyl-L-alanine amidase